MQKQVEIDAFDAICDVRYTKNPSYLIEVCHLPKNVIFLSFVSVDIELNPGLKKRIFFYSLFNADMNLLFCKKMCY